MPLRIAYFVNAYPAISHAFIRREIHALERQGHAVLRIALRGWEGDLVDPDDPAERERTHYVLRDGVAPLLLAMLQTLLRSPSAFLRALALTVRMSWKADQGLPYHLAYLAEACRILPWLREHGVQHVHAHFGTNSAEVVMLANTLGGPPYSFTVHGPLEFDRPRYLGLPEKIRRAAFVVAITSYTRSQLCRCVAHAYWPRIQVVRCGLQPEIFQSAPTPVPDSPRLVCIGRLVEQKAQLLLIEAAALLTEEGLTFDLMIVGGGPMKAELETMVQRLDLQSCVQLTGAVSTKRLYEEIRLARGLVLPSFAEGLPMVIMEAMALRRPTISTYIAGIPELVRPGENGWLVPAGAVHELADAMRALLQTRTERLQTMGDAAFTLTRERHSADVETRKLSALFERSARGEAITDHALTGAEA